MFQPAGLRVWIRWWRCDTNKPRLQMAGDSDASSVRAVTVGKRGILTFGQRRLMPETARREILLVLRAGVVVTDVQHVTVLVTRGTSGL